ncbi:hypothetical protein [Hymenobacter volaticus]|uniref:DUF4377 domain-containing protein n=1 Tax=Hymenobacter volaticus TaxID=2932254 RepID=A0ABY4G291_9BACT|nr:hypothetical protein [Hymenobacter volaticus]UOQ64689.1 hypothetical protein MUN86_14035 [Hymenobacter volaticus]
MRKYLLLAALGLSVVACSKTDEEVGPTAIAVPFNEDFSLSYRQQAVLPSSNQPELTVSLTDMQLSFCHKGAICCFGPSYPVYPTFLVTDAQGQSQEVKFPANQIGTYNTNWLDTTSVRANGQRYLLYYLKYNLKAEKDQPAKKDVMVTLRVTKPIQN